MTARDTGTRGRFALRITGLAPGPSPRRHDFTLAPGTCLAITGPSGSGKSRLLRAIADLDAIATPGRAALGAIDRDAITGPAWRRLVRYAAAEPGWWEEIVGRHFDASPAIERLGLDPSILARPVALCSTGERQRLALLRALADDPPVLLLDEPSSALDAASTGLVETLLRECLADGLILLLVTHDEPLAARLATIRLALP